MNIIAEESTTGPIPDVADARISGDRNAMATDTGKCPRVSQTPLLHSS
jgi:hypothetical protein